MNNQEIEHKFLVANDSYRRLASEQHIIRQGYLCLEPGRTVRLRLWDERAILTIKAAAPKGSIARFEWEKELSADDFKALFPLCHPGAIDKVRYIVPIGDGLKVEIDEFHGQNEGLVLAEIELPTEDTHFEKPEFLGEDVTSDPRYYNSYLSQHPYSLWK